MPSKIKVGTKRILSQIARPLHDVADKRRRREGITWDQLLTSLLSRWASGADDIALAAPVRPLRPAGPDAAEVKLQHEKWMREDPEYRRAASEKVDPSTLKFGSLAECLAADALRRGHVVPAGAFDDVEADDGVDVGE